jgi:hypothetical protein
MNPISNIPTGTAVPAKGPSTFHAMAESAKATVEKLTARTPEGKAAAQHHKQEAQVEKAAAKAQKFEKRAEKYYAHDQIDKAHTAEERAAEEARIARELEAQASGLGVGGLAAGGLAAGPHAHGVGLAPTHTHGAGFVPPGTGVAFVGGAAIAETAGGLATGYAEPVIHETVQLAPAVVETHIPRHIEILKPHIEREYEHVNIRHIVQPVHESVVTPTVEHSTMLPTRDLQFGQIANAAEIVHPIQSASTTLPVMEEFIAEAPEVVERHIRKEVDVVQPVIEREIIHPEVVYTTENIREHFREAPKIIEEGVLPTGHARRTTLEP